jgi:hypothetical protein
MKKVKVEDYNGQGQFTTFVLLNGNTTDRYDKPQIRTIEKSFDAFKLGDKESYWGSRSFGYGTLYTPCELLATARLPDNIDLPKDFYEQKVAVLRPSYQHVVILKDENDTEGRLLEDGDVLIVSEKTQRDTNAGKDTLQIMPLSKAEFEKNFLRLDNTYFRPSHKPLGGIARSKDVGSSFSLPFASQLESIKDFGEKAYKAQYDDIKSRLTTTLEAAIRGNFENALLAGQGFSSYNDALEQAMRQVAGDAAHLVGDEYENFYDTILLKWMFEDEESGQQFQDELIKQQGQDYFDALVDDWSTKAVERAMNYQVDYKQNYMNPSALFNMHARKPNEDLSAYTRIAAGTSALCDALKEKMKPLLAAHFTEATKDYKTYNLPWIGKRNKKAGFQRFLKAVGY